MDLAVANGFSGNVTVLYNNGAGAFIRSEAYAAGDYPNSVATGDLEGDGEMDMAVANGYNNDVSVFINNVPDI